MRTPRSKCSANRRNGAAVNLIWQRNRGGSCGGAPSTAGYINLMTDNNDLVTARVCLEITPLFSYVLGNTIFNQSIRSR